MEKVHRWLYPNRVVLVTCIDKAGKPNIITLAWCAPLSSAPPMLGLSIAPSRHSHELISQTKEFVVNLPPFRLAEQAMKCGTRSGRNSDKFKASGLTPRKSKRVSPPRIAECYAWLECKLVKTVEAGDHTLFVGEVVEAERSGAEPALYDAGGAEFIEVKP